MTREQILAMPASRDIDAIVAEKIMGYVRLEDQRGCVELVAPSVKDIFADRFGPGFTDKPLTVNHAPKYSTEIGAAWLVVDKMGEQGFVFELLNIASDFVGISYGSETVMHWTASFEAEEKHGVVDATAPLAIVKAALLAKLNTEGK